MKSNYVMSGLFIAALTFGIALAPSVNAKEIGQRAGPVYPPLSIEQLVQIPALQLEPKTVSYVAIGVARVYGTTLGAWSYQVTYRYTAKGWRVSGYGIAQVQQDQGVQAQVQQDQVVQDGDTYVADFRSPYLPKPDVPPGPGTVPVPGAPDNPAKPSHKIGGGCPYKIGWDAKWKWSWVPTHTDKDAWGNNVTVPGHWKLASYTVVASPSSFCG